MSGICDTCKRNNDCRKPMDGMDSCRLYVSGKESNYSKLFGTPEKAARTLADKCRDCCECVLFDAVGRSCVEQCIASNYNILLEWLKCDA